ncbi:TetR/AcrR family transcriptional regulator [Nonomuraea sp. KC401]|uniref:TetR/AcrR family transcriptional regulator n=1 Tax=unclassified Nonomuraea TaxID=2593643 RepID=UPI0010FEF0E2|nr:MULTISPECIES: TetR family transcriptional regulator [unclassified Nonomuraea]NBE93420.1 TetR family transcriptional regulator [Nonomuraea sp. K271]TLF74975.1 TetR/AcrR family transcriptional regulator [Nonomuraea sp. KC401]
MTRTFLRARRPEHKQQRREAILAAARELAAASGVRNVSLGAVAEAVGLAKSNVVRYFGTREEIYLVLTTEEYRSWAEAVTGRLRTARDVDDVVAALAETIAERPLFCDLLSHSSVSLEHNVSVEAARTYKRGVVTMIDELGTQVARASHLTESEARELVGAAAVTAGLLYPAANPPPVLAEVYAQEPELARHCPQLLPTVHRFLAALAAGLPTLRPPAG